MFKKKIRTLYHILLYLGIDFKRVLSIRFFFYYIVCALKYFLAGGKINKFIPILFDREQKAGNIKDHYFLQDLHCARLIYIKDPINHIDVGSRIDGFISHLATFRIVEVCDIRDLDVSFDKNIIFKQLDITKEIPRKFQSKYISVSCLHTIEHIGLGRYGDNIDINGHIKAVENLSKLLKKNGLLYLSFPISTKNIVIFNMHRVFEPKYILSLEIIQNKFKLINFDYIDDNGYLIKDVMPDDIKEIPEYGCGIYQFKKINN